MTRDRGLLLAVPCFLLAFAGTADARADKAACLSAASQGQRFRDNHKLVEAREQFRSCAAGDCPSVVQSDCANWLSEVERDLPSVVVSAKSGSGKDLVEVRVTVDGQPLASKLEGQAIPMNPGSHAFHFETSDGKTLDQPVVVREGEKNHPVAVVIGPPEPAAPAAPGEASSPDHPSEAASPTSGWRLVEYIGFGVGAVGIIGGAVTGILAMGDASSVKNACQGTTCPRSIDGDLQTGRTLGTLSTVAFAVGGVGAAVGVLGLLLAPKSAAPATGGATFEPWIGIGAVGARGSF
jgi:hypothetical protein